MYEQLMNSPNITIKENNDLMIMYLNDKCDKLNDLTELELNCKSVILNKSDKRVICTQYNQILYNVDALQFLQNKDWSKVVVQRCYEGTMLLVYHHNGSWHVSTRRCLDASDSNWVKNKSYRQMFDEAIQGKFTFDDLNVDYCYHFVLIHYKNKNIVSYSTFGFNYKEVLHVLTTKKYSLEEVNTPININVKTVGTESFNSLSDLLDKLTNVSVMNEQYRKITMEGYVLKYYPDTLTNTQVILKLQTDIYQKLSKLKPNNSNINQAYLEMYQQDKLKEFLPYFTRYRNDVLSRLHISMRTVAKEILDVYHLTRQKKNPNIYNMLPEQYKKVLYGLHGMYIDNRKGEFIKKDVLDDRDTKSINIHDVYHYLKKELKASELRQLYFERVQMLKNEVYASFLNKNCLASITQSTLMFQTD